MLSKNPKKKIAVVAIVILGICILSSCSQKKLEPLYEKPYIVVFGVEKCPVSQSLKRRLDKEGMEYEWVDLDTSKEYGWDFIQKRKKIAGIPETARVPYIEINGKLFARPPWDTIVDTYYKEGEEGPSS